ncbi:hypothetical protein SLS61_007064 [Didymella pomorum]
MSPSRFMELPAELRIEVYKLLAVIGKVFYTPDGYDLGEGLSFEYYKDSPTPSLTILRVSKAIHEEAEDVYLSQNTFVLPSAFDTMRPFDKSSEDRCAPHRQLFSDRALLKLKHVSLALCIRAWHAPLVPSHGDWEDTDLEEMTATEILETAHDIVHDFASSSRISIAWTYEDLDGLQSAEVDFTNAYCPFGCCRFLDFDWLSMVGCTEKIKIIGLNSTKEKNKIMEAYQKATDESIGGFQQL